MKNNSSSTFASMLWKFAERCSVQLISLVVSIVLARMLMPDDYSVVSIVAIFFVVCNVFISGGFSTALIQKKSTDSLDYATVLTISLGVAGVMYLVVFIVAPYISLAYEKEILTIAFRVMGLTFFINALKSVLCAYISKNMQFRKFFFSTIIGTIISAVIGITMAVNGCGAWSLVAQQMSNSAIDTLILLATAKLKIRLGFSLSRFKELFNYGWKIFVSGIISVIYDESRPLVVGLKFSATDLAYYNKGQTYPNLVNATVCDTISSVLFPAMARVQDSKEAVLKFTRQFMQVSSYLIFPIMIGLLMVSDEFIIILLTEKWAAAIPYVKIFCLSGLLAIVQTGNLQAIRAIGRSDVILILEIIKKSLYLAIILLFIFLSDQPTWLAFSTVICALLASVINSIPNRKLIGYRYIDQIKDLGVNMLLAAAMAGCVYLVGLIGLSIYWSLILKVLTGAVVYVLLSVVTKNKSFKYILRIVTQKFARKRIVNQRKH